MGFLQIFVPKLSQIIEDDSVFLLIFISSVDRIKKKLTFALEFISQMRKGNRRTQAVDALRPLLLFQIHQSSSPLLGHLVSGLIFPLNVVCGKEIVFIFVT